MSGASKRIAAETINLEQVGEEPSLGAALTLFQKHSQAWWQESFSCSFYDTAGLGWLPMCLRAGAGLFCCFKTVREFSESLFEILCSSAELCT